MTTLALNLAGWLAVLYSVYLSRKRDPQKSLSMALIAVGLFLTSLAISRILECG